MVKENQTAAEAEAEAVATRTPPDGVEAALEHLQNFDEEAQVLWQCNGPRRTRTRELAAIMAEIDGQRFIYIVQVFTSGKFKLFREVMDDNSKAPDEPKAHE